MNPSSKFRLPVNLKSSVNPSCKAEAIIARKATEPEKPLSQKRAVSKGSDLV